MLGIEFSNLIYKLPKTPKENEGYKSLIQALESVSTDKKEFLSNKLNESHVGWKFLLNFPDCESAVLIIGDELGIKGLNQ